MPETTKERDKRWYPIIVACAVLIGISMWVSALLPTEEQPPAVRAEVTTGSAFPQWLTLQDGQMVRLAADGATVLERYDTAVTALPAEEQQRLKDGIRVSDEAELAGWLESYTS